MNYENKNSYSIAIVATSGVGDDTRRSRLDVTVHVIDAEDTGSVSLNRRGSPRWAARWSPRLAIPTAVSP